MQFEYEPNRPRPSTRITLLQLLFMLGIAGIVAGILIPVQTHGHHRPRVIQPSAGPQTSYNPTPTTRIP